jgi:hypothetical protein
MSSPTDKVLAIRSSSSRFAPRKLEIVSIGKTSVSDPEKAMAFQQNKTALALANLDQKARILVERVCFLYLSLF